jgi:hypothetical protein
MKFKYKEKLDAFLTDIDSHLMDDKNKLPVQFTPKNVSPWNGEELASENEDLLANASKKANLYMLFTANKNDAQFKLRYIGKTTRKLARQRLRNHLFKKNDGTGAKLDKIMSHVIAGGCVKISWITIEPETLRNWAEEELINSHTESDWNHGNT